MQIRDKEKLMLTLASNKRFGVRRDRRKALCQILEEAGIKLERHLVSDKAEHDGVIVFWDSDSAADSAFIHRATNYANSGSLISVRVGPISSQAWERVKSAVNSNQHFDLQSWNENEDDIALHGVLAEVENVISYPPILSFIRAKNRSLQDRWEYARAHPEHPTSQAWAQSFEKAVEESIATEIDSFEAAIDTHRGSLDELSKRAIQLCRTELEAWRAQPFSERQSTPPAFAAPDLKMSESASDLAVHATATAAGLSRKLQDKERQLRKRRLRIPWWAVAGLLIAVLLAANWRTETQWTNRYAELQRELSSQADKETYAVLAQTQRNLEVRLDDLKIDSDARDQENYDLFAEYLTGCWERGDAVRVPCDKVEFVFRGNMNVERHCYRGQMQSSSVSTIGRNFIELDNGAMFFRPKNPNTESSEVNEIWWGSRVYRENDDFGYAGIYKQIEGAESCSG